MTLQVGAIFKEKMAGSLKNDIGNLVIFMKAVASLKICNLMSSFCRKHIKFQMKKQRRIMSHETERVIQRKANS